MRSISGYHGLFELTPHALARIRERFGIEHPAEAMLWAMARMAEATHHSCNLGRRYILAPRILWHCDAGVRIVTDGNWIMTAYAEGEVEEEGAA